MNPEKAKYILSTVCASILVFSFFLIGIAHSATITVKQLGGGDYTTISDAISNAQQDDTIMVYHGRYEEAVVIDKNLSLIGLGPQFVIIDSPSDGVKIDSNIVATIRGFTITSAGIGIMLSTNANATIINNCIVSNGNHGVYMNNASSTTVGFLKNNIIAHNAGSGVILGGTWNFSGKYYVHNNIISNNSSYGIYVSTKTSGVIINSYNDVFSNTDGNYSGSTAHSTDISLSPQFINSDNGNFALQGASPCINSGSPGSADADPDGSRNDMGVFGGPDSASFWPYPQGAPIITNLNATPTSVPKGSTITINATGEVYE